jgi:Protein of unknown function (DUF3631)
VTGQPRPSPFDIPAESLPPDDQAVERPAELARLNETLTAIEGLLCRFIHFTDPAHAAAITLWIALTHTPAQFETLIYLVITSAVKQSGKTRLFDVLEELVPSPWRVVRPSEAVTFRRIDRDHPTLLLDEYDTIFGDRSGQFEGIRAIFNSGNRRGTKVSRAMAKGKGFELVDFDIFSPKALAGIGPLPDTVADRAIVIQMSRRARGEAVERLQSRRFRPLAEPLRTALSRSLQGLDLSRAEPEIPDALGDRAADGWEPLLAIADAAGGDWPRRARAAAITLNAEGAAVDESHGITLLADIRTVFAQRAIDRLWTADLIEALVAIEESPWGDIRGRSVTPTYLARLLRPFGIGPKPVRRGEAVKRGYDADQFEDTWRRYLPDQGSTDVPPASRYDRYGRYTDQDESESESRPQRGSVAGVTPVADQPGVWHRDGDALSRVPEPEWLGITPMVPSPQGPPDAQEIAAAWGISIEADYPRSAWDTTDV